MADLIYLAKVTKLIGLIFSIFSSALLYRYSLPKVIDGGSWDDDNNDDDNNYDKTIEYYHPKYRKGFRILFIGFLLQFIGEMIC